MTLDQRVLKLLKTYMGKLFQKKVLTSMEEVEANTNETNLVSAPVIAELNNKLSGFEPVLDATGEITGYKTDIGGADTVFPFSAKRDIVLGLTQGTVGPSAILSYTSDKAPCDGNLAYTFSQNGIQAYAKKNGTTFSALTTYSHDTGYSSSGTLSVKKGDVITISTGERSGHGNGVLFVGRYL